MHVCVCVHIYVLCIVYVYVSGGYHTIHSINTTKFGINVPNDVSQWADVHCLGVV